MSFHAHMRPNQSRVEPENSISLISLKRTVQQSSTAVKIIIIIFFFSKQRLLYYNLQEEYYFSFSAMDEQPLSDKIFLWISVENSCGTVFVSCLRCLMKSCPVFQEYKNISSRDLSVCTSAYLCLFVCLLIYLSP